MSARKKRALGRGLDALLSPPPESAEVHSLPLDRLRPNRLQPRSRFDEEALADLARSIESQGVVQPLVVTPDGEGPGYVIVAGERRWRAAGRAGLESVPVVVREIRDDRQLLETALVENLQRTDLNPMEEAEAYRRLADDFGLTQEQIAQRVGKSRPTVANALRLLKLPAAVQEMVRDGRLTAGQARPLLAIEDRQELERLARRAVSAGLTARQLEARVRRGPSAKRSKSEPDADTAAAAERLTRRLQAKVEIHRSGRGGTLRIGFHSEEELIRLFELLMKVGARS